MFTEFMCDEVSFRTESRECVFSEKKKRRRDVDNVPLPTPFWTFELGQKR
jgi:hypothetical protein